ncbi:MAG TPA: ATP-binding protein [Thermoanaerobaculia bacterium]|nr:ATP-binding protein [Thermoanaerobaculia bacterium]
MSLRARVLLALFANAAFAVAVAFLLRRIGVPEPASFAAALLVDVPLLIWSASRIVHTVDFSLISLEDGLLAFNDGDFGMRLAPNGGRRLTTVKQIYNAVADTLRTQRNDVYQKELLLDTILQRTPVAVILVTSADRIVYSNTAAREWFASRLDGMRFSEVVQALAAPIRDALANEADAIAKVGDETFHVSQRTFALNTIEHRLVLVERLTAELRRQEIAVWKNAIRVINHELNNTIAPISSMIHTARIAQERPEHRHRLGEIYATIEERLAFLRTFLESYAQFARLPAPSKERTAWREILDDVHALYGFRIEGNPDETSMIDRGQMQQVLINLVKNAHESGSDAAHIVVAIHRAPDGTVVRVLDRGSGMPDPVLRNAFVPFYTTKPSGSGLGLPLCHEILEAHHGRLHVQAREGGGTAVTCWVP